MSKKIKVAIIEDETDIAEIIESEITPMGHQPKIFNNGVDLIEYVQNDEPFDLFILDRLVQGKTGIEVCRFLRLYKTTATTPILMITAMTKPEHVVEGLEAGADDYITKPFDINVVCARVRALLRRAEVIFATKPLSKISPKILSLQGIKMDLEQFKVWVDTEEISLTPSEFKILKAFLAVPGKVLTRNQLIEFVQEGTAMVTDRTIDTHVFGLRKKLKVYAAAIETIR